MKIKTLFTVLTAYTSILLSQSLYAEIDVLEKDPGLEVARDALQANDLLSDSRPDRDFINTALVLSNQGARPTTSYCVATNHRGQRIGRAHTKIAGNGVSILLASDLTNGLDFVGKIHCLSRRHVVGTGFIVGTGLTDTRVTNLNDRAGSKIVVQAAVSR